jgi:hypothetical protein
MRKTIFLAALALLALSAVSGCTKVRKCTKGEQGCIGGRPNVDGTCEAGLIAKGSKCVEASGGSSGCNCAIDEVCGADGETCIGYCEYDDSAQVLPVPKGCEPPLVDPPLPAYGFAELCANACEQTCLRAQTYCPGYVCNLAACKEKAALDRCKADCPNDNVKCLKDLCVTQQAAACQGFTCPGTFKTDCADVRCNDSCSSDNIQDGFCDDGDPESAVYSFCGYGTDCSDCGPRRGSRSARVQVGEVCPARQDVACEGYNDNFLVSSAWCLRVSEDNTYPFRCVPGCTTNDGPGECPDGYDCVDAEFDDAFGHPGYLCQPLVVCK